MNLKLKNIPQTDEDYVVLYAEHLKQDSSLFAQQKLLIESQLESSKAVFREKFGEGEEFKKKARAYLKSVGMLE